MISKILKILMVFVLVISSMFIAHQKAEAVVGKVVSIVAKKAAKESVKKVIEKKALSTISEMGLKKVSGESFEHYVKKEGFDLVQKAGEKQVYHLKDVSKLTQTEKDRLLKVVDNKIDKTFTSVGPDVWLLDDIVNFFTDYKTIIAGVSLLSMVLTGAQAEWLNKITFESLYEADLLTPAPSIVADTNVFTDYSGEKTYSLDESPVSLPSWGYHVQKSYPVKVEPQVSYFYGESEIFSDGNVFGKIIALDLPGVTTGDEFFRFQYEMHANYDFYAVVGMMLSTDNQDVPGVSFWESLDWGDFSTKFYLNGKQIYDDYGWFSITDNPGVYNLIKNIKRVKMIFPDNSSGNFAIEVNDTLGNVFKVLYTPYYINPKVKLNTFSTSFSSDMPLSTSMTNVSIRVLDSPQLHGEIKPIPRIDDLAIGKGIYEVGEVTHFPNITEIPMELPNGVPIKPVVVPAEVPYIEIIEVPTGEPVPDTIGDIVAYPPADLPVSEPLPPSQPVNPSPQAPTVPGGGSGGEGEVPSRDPNDEVNKLSQLVTTQFPFSLPWDVYDVFKAINAEPKTPVIGVDTVIQNRFFGEVPIKIEHDMKYLEPYMPFFRAFIILSFTLFLVFATPRFFGGAK